MANRIYENALIGGALLLCASGLAHAQGIAGSPHDLGGGTVGDNGEICAYCHTPHAARTDIEAPLWNKPDTGSTYDTYDSTTIDGDVLTVGSVSVACLTCHDGTQAMDAMINAPGSGLGTLGSGTVGNEMAPGIVAMLGTDLRNDHPIGIQYGGFDPGGGQIDPDFKNSTNGLQTATFSGQTRWWVDTEATPNAARNKTDMILYTRDNSGNGGLAAEPFVECASCHDPHQGGAANVRFMRILNTDSAVCLACHVK